MDSSPIAWRDVNLDDNINQIISTLDNEEDEEDDDALPSTQPVDQRVLKDVVAYVEVRTDADNRSAAVENELEKLGATIEKKLSKNVTHVVFKDGKKKTIETALKRKLKLVTVLWVDRCRMNQEHVSEGLFPVASTGANLTPMFGRLKKMKSMQPKDFDEELASSAERAKRTLKRRENKLKKLAWRNLFSDESQPDKEIMDFSPRIPETPPYLQARFDQLKKEREEISESTEFESIEESDYETDLRLSLDPSPNSPDLGFNMPVQLRVGMSPNDGPPSSPEDIFSQNRDPPGPDQFPSPISAHVETEITDTDTAVSSQDDKKGKGPNKKRRKLFTSQEVCNSFLLEPTKKVMTPSSSVLKGKLLNHANTPDAEISVSEIGRRMLLETGDTPTVNTTRGKKRKRTNTGRLGKKRTKSGTLIIDNEKQQSTEKSGSGRTNRRKSAAAAVGREPEVDSDKDSSKIQPKNKPSKLKADSAKVDNSATPGDNVGNTPGSIGNREEAVSKDSDSELAEGSGKKKGTSSGRTSTGRGARRKSVLTIVQEEEVPSISSGKTEKVEKKSRRRTLHGTLEEEGSVVSDLEKGEKRGRRKSVIGLNAVQESGAEGKDVENTSRSTCRRRSAVTPGKPDDLEQGTVDGHDKNDGESESKSVGRRRSGVAASGGRGKQVEIQADEGTGQGATNEKVETVSKGRRRSGVAASGGRGKQIHVDVQTEANKGTGHGATSEKVETVSRGRRRSGVAASVGSAKREEAQIVAVEETDNVETISRGRRRSGVLHSKVITKQSEVQNSKPEGTGNGESEKVESVSKGRRRSGVRLSAKQAEVQDEVDGEEVELVSRGRRRSGATLAQKKVAKAGVEVEEETEADVSCGSEQPISRRSVITPKGGKEAEPAVTSGSAKTTVAVRPGRRRSTLTVVKETESTDDGLGESAEPPKRARRKSSLFKQTVRNELDKSEPKTKSRRRSGALENRLTADVENHSGDKSENCSTVAGSSRPKNVSEKDSDTEGLESGEDTSLLDRILSKIPSSRMSIDEFNLSPSVQRVSKLKGIKNNMKKSGSLSTAFEEDFSSDEDSVLDGAGSSRQNGTASVTSSKKGRNNVKKLTEQRNSVSGVKMLDKKSRKNSQGAENKSMVDNKLKKKTKGKVPIKRAKSCSSLQTGPLEAPLYSHILEVRRASAAEKKLPSIVTTSLHYSEQDIVQSILEKLGGFRLVEKVDHTTTHVICGKNRRTLNILHAITRGCWIVTPEWAFKSLDFYKWLEEEPFQCTKFFPACEKKRLQEFGEGSKFHLNLFSDVGSVYISDNCAPPAGALKELVKACGGRTSTSIRSADVIVGKAKKNSKCVTEKWILDSIMEVKCLPFGEYLLCAADVSVDDANNSKEW